MAVAPAGLGVARIPARQLWTRLSMTGMHVKPSGDTVHLTPVGRTQGQCLALRGHPLPLPSCSLFPLAGIQSPSPRRTEVGTGHGGISKAHQAPGFWTNPPLGRAPGLWLPGSGYKGGLIPTSSGHSQGSIAWPRTLPCQDSRPVGPGRSKACRGPGGSRWSRQKKLPLESLLREIYSHVQ